MTAMPPESFARRSWSFSFSYSDVVASIISRSISTRSATASEEP
jgi:hypothetical protein